MERCDIYLEDTLQRILDCLRKYLWGTGSRLTSPGVYLCNSLFWEAGEEKGL